MTRLEQIADAVEDFAITGKVLAQLLATWDPTHAQLIAGVIGASQKIAKGYTSNPPVVLGTP